MLAFATLVVVNRNPVASALSLVVTFLSLAALFVGLNAYFIAVIQVLVYAGAVMVLFLFIIMLMDLKAERRRKFNLLAVGGGVLVSVGFIGELVLVLGRFKLGESPFPALRAEKIDDVREVGMTLFTTHNLPFQVIGVLILVATIGVVILSRRELK
ncbi:MAG: NADH:ubiquinone oxidoreductase subunit 6 [Chthoniobacteraceae bacterium]|nr:NADH:ubiquinone oxidoreductase subunit 6 [Chthoniobacteraceae bacterium]